MMKLQYDLNWTLSIMIQLNWDNNILSCIHMQKVKNEH